MNKHYPGEQLGNYHKKGKGKLPLFGGNVERVIPIYAKGALVALPSLFLLFQPIRVSKLENVICYKKF